MLSKWTRKEHDQYPSSTGQFDLQGRRRSSSTATVRQPQMDLASGKSDHRALSPNRLLTVDSNESSSGKRTRGRSMSARLRPHLEETNSPKQTTSGSVRVRRTSDMVNEIGQLRLTPVQITLVRKLWQIVRVQGKNGAGLQIFRDHLFFRYPDIRDLFAITGPVPTEANYHKRLMSHAEALGDLLDEVITNLEQSDALRDKIRDLGKLHIKSRDIGFKAAYWDSLAEALNECTLAWCQKAQRRFETQVAMTTVVMFIVDNLKDGYMEECRRLRRSVYDAGSHVRNHRDPSRSPRHVT